MEDQGEPRQDLILLPLSLITISQKFRTLFWDFIVEGKEGLGKESAYDFKYVPELGAQTGSEVMDPSVFRTYGGVETIAFASLIFAIFALLIGVAVTWKLGNLVAWGAPAMAVVAWSG